MLTVRSTFESTAPRKRYGRQISGSLVGRAGNSPSYAHIRGVSPTRERRSLETIDEAVKGDDVTSLWKHCMDLDRKPVTNRELGKVGLRLANLLTKDLSQATNSGDKEAIEKAVAAADGKLQIVGLGGLPELMAAKKELGMDPRSMPDPRVMAGLPPDPKVTAGKQPGPKVAAGLQKKSAKVSAKVGAKESAGTSSLNTTADSIALEDGDADEEDDAEEADAEEADAEEADEADEDDEVEEADAEKADAEEAEEADEAHEDDEVEEDAEEEEGEETEEY